MILLPFLHAHLRRQLHPVPGGIGRKLLLRAPADEAQEGHILRAAGHGHTSGNEFCRRHLLPLQHHSGEADVLSDVPLRVVHAVHKPDAVVLRLHFNLRLAQIIGQILRQHILRDLAVPALQDQHGILAHGTDLPAIVHQLILGNVVAAVHDTELRLPQHLSQEGLHVVEIEVQGRAVHNGDDLIDHPAFRKRHLIGRLPSLLLCQNLFAHGTVIEIILVPHAVPLNENALRLVLLLQLAEIFPVELGNAFHDDRDRIVLLQEFRRIFILALLAKQQQRGALGLEVLLGHSILDKLRFSGLQEAVDQKYGQAVIIQIVVIACCHFFSPLFLLLLSPRRLPSAAPH